MSDTVASPARTSAGGVQSIERAFELLEMLADFGGVAGLSELTAKSGLPLPTIHRLLRTLVRLGYVRQEPSREYALGPRLATLGESATHLIAYWARPHLDQLVDELGESANLALLDNDAVLYVAQAPGRHSMRMFTEVGRRVGVHCTAVGKAILAGLPEERTRTIIGRAGLEPHTDRTITDLPALLAELQIVRAQGFAVDDGEQEAGVKCIAVALPGSPPRAAVSISAPMSRMSDADIERALPALRATAERLAKEFDASSQAHGRGA
jgi:IclR family acetate operon transcriptional repressor